MKLNHIALIVSSEASIDFYGKLGFTETTRIRRVNDTVVFMECDSIVLEIFIDPNHPERLSYPEALGLRHFCLTVENFDEFIQKFDHEPIRTNFFGRRLVFIKDPDGLPIELTEGDIE